jgi:hypothetical protein
MSLAFTNVITPLGRSSATRVKAWRNWCSVLTWAASCSTLDRILPMDTPVLQAMLWDFTLMGSSNSVLKSIVDAVVARHREARLPSPVLGLLSYSRLTRCLASVPAGHTVTSTVSPGTWSLPFSAPTPLTS